MKRVFVTHILDERLIQKYKLSTAGCNFSFNLISGNCFDEVFSILGTNAGGTLDSEAYNDSRYKLFYINALRKLGKIGVVLSSFFEQACIFFKVQRGCSVWLYNVTDLNLLLIFLLSLFKHSVQINVIVLDFTPQAGKYNLANLCLKAINKADRNIRLADSSLFTCSNSILLPGVVPSNAGNEPTIQEPNNRFLLSGVLFEHIAQTSMVLKAFTNIPECELHITGFTSDESVIKEYASKYSNIIYHGQTTYNEYLDIMHSCTYQLSTRDPEFPENRCNFPSKIIEAFLHNRIVVSTIEYKQLDGIQYFIVSGQLEQFIQNIKDINHKTSTNNMQYANQGHRVANMFSVDVWKSAMDKIESVS